MPDSKRWKVPSFVQVMRVSGLGIAIFETLYERVDRPSILILAAGMMGFDSVVKAQKKGGNGE